MDDTPYREFFARPAQPYHRRYEALRAVFLDGRPQKEVAQQFGYRYRRCGSWSMSSDAKALVMPPPFSRAAVRPPGRAGAAAPSRVNDDAQTETPEVADRQRLVLSVADPLRLETHRRLVPLPPVVGAPEVRRAGPAAGYPGSRMVPADAALLSLLTLKLLDKERRSHIDDFNFDEALGLFAGLNILPKKSFATDYSYRTAPDQQRRLLAGWVKALAPVLFPEADTFSLDFHPIPYRGDEAGLENHYIPRRGTAGKRASRPSSPWSTTAASSATPTPT